MLRILVAVAVIAGCAVLAVTVFPSLVEKKPLTTVDITDPVYRSAISEREYRAFDAKAEQACRCARGKGYGAEYKACWASLKTAADEFGFYEIASACGPGSTSHLCFDNDHCLLVDHGLGGCNGKEIEVLEAMYAQLEARNASDEEFARVLKETQQKLDAKQVVVVPKGADICS